ncbi:MAG: hypothetical protein ABGX16_21070 [Pirellulales bacterium]
MAKSLVAQLGQSIVEIINESNLVVAERVYGFPGAKLEHMDRNAEVYLRSSVLESPQQDVPHSRGHRFIDVPFDLLLGLRVDGYEIEDVDGALGLYEVIDQHIYEHGKMIALEATGIKAQWLLSIPGEIVNHDDLRSSKVVQVMGQILYRYSL